MHTVELIYKALPKEESEWLTDVAVPGICCVTGEKLLTIDRKKILGNSFTGWGLLAAPRSDRISVEAAIALKYKPERMSSWFCDGETFTKLDRIGVREKVFQEDMPTQWAGYATTSYKKHGSIMAPVNVLNQRVWLFETRLVGLSDMDKVEDWWHNLNKILRAGFSRPVIESLECPPYVMRKQGMREWMDFEAWARPRFKSALYAFLCYLLPSQKELKDEQTGSPTP